MTSSGTEANLVAGYLRANSIQAVVQGGKEHASIITEPIRTPFHFASIYYLFKLVRSEKSVSSVIWVPVVVTLNVIGLYVWYDLYLT